MKLLDMFDKFVQDEQAWEMFITGPAGTGKTTGLKQLAEYCTENGINFTVAAHTHKACDILRQKLPQGTTICTLWSFLGKRPTINDQATNVKQIQGSITSGDSDTTSILFVDEFGMVGEKDLMDLRALQDPEYSSTLSLKIVGIGDLNQLPPIGDQQTWIPHKPYWHKLTKVYRQAGDSELLRPLQLLVKMIEGGEVEALPGNKDFVRDLEDAELELRYHASEDAAFLCYTNQAVQHWNRQLQGRDEPEPGDKLFSASAHRFYTFLREMDPSEVDYIDRLYDDPLHFNSKYKTLEFLLQSNMARFFEVEDEEGDVYVFPVKWGTYDYKVLRNELGVEGANANRAIESKHGNPKVWASKNYGEPLARKRALAWRRFMTFNDTMLCMDFAHAITVHKSQGSTFKNVFIDAQDLYQCANRRMDMYLRLFYVAISRASNKVYTN